MKTYIINTDYLKNIEEINAENIKEVKKKILKYIDIHEKKRFKNERNK